MLKFWWERPDSCARLLRDRQAFQRVELQPSSTLSLPLPGYRAPGGLRQAPSRPVESLGEARNGEHGRYEMRVLLSTYGSRGNVEPMVDLRCSSRGTVGVCAPLDFAELLGSFGILLVPVGEW